MQADLLQGDTSKTIFTLAKLGRFVVLGVVHDPHRARWRGSRIEPSSGIIRARKYELPKALLDYLNEKADQIHRALASVSERQSQKIEASFRANVDRFIESDAFAAMNADVGMFGEKAFATSSGAADAGSKQSNWEVWLVTSFCGAAAVIGKRVRAPVPLVVSRQSAWPRASG